MKHILRQSIIAILLILHSFYGYSSGFSYIYIQGDKETPFYVKLEDEMLPRYGKNYCIIPQLAPGPIHIKILFQQNLYPAQSFTIQVPENGYRGFLLIHKAEEFKLYDIQQQFYIISGNNAEDDHAPVNQPGNDYVPTQVGPAADSAAASDITAVVVETTTPIKTDHKETTGPEFIDVELKNDRTLQNSNTLPGGNTTVTARGDCTKAVDIELFEAIQKKANDKRDDMRLKYLLSKAEENCFNTTQVRILTKTLPNDPERYTFLKKVYSKVTDPTRFPALEALLSTQEWKSYFKLILQ